MYFAIYGMEKIGIRISKVEDIEEFLKEAVEDATIFLDDFPKYNGSKREQIDINSQPENFEMILIKGEIIVPKIKEKVTVYEIDENEV